MSDSRAFRLVCFGANATQSNSWLTMAQAGALQDCAGKLKTGLNLKCWVVLCVPVRANSRTHKVVDREYGYEIDHVRQYPHEDQPAGSKIVTTTSCFCNKVKCRRIKTQMIQQAERDCKKMLWKMSRLATPRNPNKHTLLGMQSQVLVMV